MKKDDIKKALEYCASDSIDDCKNCPYAGNGPFACSISMYKDALNLITEQEKEINALQEENRRLDEYVSCTLSAQELDEEIKQAKIDVLNELTVKAVSLSAIETYHICNLVNELIKEIVK